MLRRWLGLESRPKDSDIEWSIAQSPAGERLLVLAPKFGPFKAPVIRIAEDGRISILDAASRAGGSHRLAAAPADTLISSSRSLILGTYNGKSPAFAVAPVLKKGQKPAVGYSRGKIHAVLVGRVVDDGRETGTWRGFVTADGRKGEVFLELAPALPLPAGSELRIVGYIDDEGMGAEASRRYRFRRGAWIPVDERIALFAADLRAEIGASDDADEGGSQAAMAACLAAAAALHHGRRGTKERLPFTCSPLGFDETPAQKGLRSRMMAANEGSRAQRPFSGGRVMAVPATDWHGAVQDNGDLIIEIRRKPFPTSPSSITVIVNRTMVSTLDGMPSRIGLRCVFPDGRSTSMLLGGGPQRLANEIAKRRTVVVVQGEPGAKTYADLSMSVAGVERR
jgi:hypothetical protein